MPQHTPLVTTIVASIVLAFLFGAIAQRLRVSPLVGYMLAGVAAGPFSPIFVADQTMANDLAEIGVILLMFGVGLHFSPKDLFSVRGIALPGAIVQIGVATLLGFGLARVFGWSSLAGLVFGLSLSVASTVVLLRALQERRLLQTERGRIAVGWLIIEDIATVVVLLLLPAVAELAANGMGQLAVPATFGVRSSEFVILLASTLGKVGAFVVVMLVAGRRLIPWILHTITQTGSRELFRLAVLAIALGFAYGAAELFGVSFALGAFFAGMILSESELSQRATEETLPLRDAFSVLFFVSVGMLFNPEILVQKTWAILATLLIIILGKSLTAYLIVRILGRPVRTALAISASLAQIGEFSFVLAGFGVQLHLLPEAGLNLIVAGAILSIFLNPAFFYLVDRFSPAPSPKSVPGTLPQPASGANGVALKPVAMRDHVVLIGYGRVGSVIAEDVKRRGLPLLVIEENGEVAAIARAHGHETIEGNGATPEVLDAANLRPAHCLVVAIPNGFEAGQSIAQAKALAPTLKVVVRAHSDAELDYLKELGANAIILGEREIALGMIAALFPKPGTGPTEGGPPPGISPSA